LTTEDSLFPRISKAKKKKIEFFLDTQITQLSKDKYFNTKLNYTKKEPERLLKKPPEIS
jgi:hypothetical protein